MHSARRYTEASVPTLAIATGLWLINARQDAIDAIGCRSRLYAYNMLVCLFHHSLQTQSSLAASLLLHDQPCSCIEGFTLEVASKAHVPKTQTFEVACLKILSTMTRYTGTLYRHSSQAPSPKYPSISVRTRQENVKL